MEKRGLGYIRCVLIAVFAFLYATLCLSIEHRWTNASKEVVGTPFGSDTSPVWFTLSQGIINEVYYPRIDRAQVGDSQLLFTGIPGKLFLDEKRGFDHSLKHSGLFLWPLIESVYRNGNFEIRFQKEVVVDPHHPVLRIRYRFINLPPSVRIFILHKPAASNSPNTNLGQIVITPQGKTMVGWNERESEYQVVTSTAPILNGSVGIVGIDDGWQDLSNAGKLVHQNPSGGPDNIALTASIAPESSDFEVNVGFGNSAKNATEQILESLKTPFDTVTHAYDEGWSRYLTKLANAPWMNRLDSKQRNDVLWSAAVIKAHEDKQSQGAIIASLSLPDLPEGKGALARTPDGSSNGGYHLVWARDLYKSAMALLSLDDVETARNVLQFMMRMEKNGKITQNVWVNGTTYWRVQQMDQEAYPVLLADALKKTGVTIDATTQAFLDRRIERIRSSGGKTKQERWEEAEGYSPNTIAVMAAALRAIGDKEGAKQMLKIALEKTVSRSGPLSKLPYFIRISKTGNPDSGELISIANTNDKKIPANQVLDGGFLEWLRYFSDAETYFEQMGTELKQIIANTMALYTNPQYGVNRTVRSIPLYGRYSEDAYGQHGMGGCWPILTGESALTDLAQAKSPDETNAIIFQTCSDMRKLWGPGDLCPEQVVIINDNPHPMPHAASPLVWSHAEFILLMSQVR